MTDLPHSLRALYFAPMPLVVLNPDQSIWMINRPAEEIFALGAAECLEKGLDRYLDPQSRAQFTSSIIEAAHIAANQSHSAPASVTSRLQLQQSSTTQAPGIWADFTISAWFPTDAMPSLSTASFSNLTMGSSDHNENHVSSRVAQQAHYTISIIPATVIQPQEASNPSSENHDLQSDLTFALKESAFRDLDTAVFILGKDRKTQVLNRACEQLFTIFEIAEAAEVANVEDVQEVDFVSWATSALRLYDENFEHVVDPSEWPIFRTSIDGCEADPRNMGLEVKASGKRLLLGIESKMLRDKDGLGQHIGGYTALRDITKEREKMKLESELQSDLHFKQTVDTMPQLIWQASSTGYVHWYSNSFYQYTGLTQKQLEGTGWTEFVHSDDLPKLASEWSDCLSSGHNLDSACRLRRYDGVFRWVLCRASPMRDPSSGEIVKWFGTNTDVHDQVEALSTSQRIQAQLQSVINHAAVTLWALDRDGIITMAEGSWARRLQAKVDMDMHLDGKANTLVGRSIYDLWTAETNARDMMAMALRGETAGSEIWIEGRCFRMSYSPLREQRKDVLTIPHASHEPNSEASMMDLGEIIGVVVVSMDVTDRKQAEESMKDSIVEKTRALAAEGAAREASRLKSQFLANMSHEIRTPIAGIIGLSELLLDEARLEPRHRDYAETIERSAEGLLTVINDVLDFSKVEIGKLDIEMLPFDLVTLLGDLRKMFIFATEKKGLRFDERLQFDYRGYLIGDVGRLRQVLTNLLTNAIKFTTQGSVSLQVSQHNKDDGTILVRFDIQDTGCGIHPDTLRQLFKPFSQADSSTARRFGGTGLGLSISKNLVELMGGGIGLNSVEGSGSHAWFIIPFQKGQSLGDPPNLLKRSNGTLLDHPIINKRAMLTKGELDPRNRADIRILIAEDNEVNARIASKNVEKMGFSCDVAENGLIALQALEKKRYDAILMDCQMPDCDGYEATRLIRNSEKIGIRTLPIIALTASAIKGDSERALDAGMVDYLTKPVKRPILEEVLCKWLFDSDTRLGLARYLYAPTPSGFASQVE